MSESCPGIAASSRLARAGGYVRPAAAIGLRTPVLLRLDANECPVTDCRTLGDIAWCEAEVGRYPTMRPLEQAVAARLGIDSERVVVTAGADDALGRICMALVEDGRNVVLATPTFEMIPIYARQAGGEVREVPWAGGTHPFPVEATLAAVDARTAAVFVVSPNNPTGAAARPEDLRRIRDAARGVVLVVDAAYEEFADQPLTPEVLAMPGAVVTRTFSKAFGLAGLRIGYAAGDTRVIEWMRRVGQPYAVSGVSARLVLEKFEDLRSRAERIAERVRFERVQLEHRLRLLGAVPLASQANFVLARTPEAARIADRLATRGIIVRTFPGRPGLDDAIRITCPAGEAAFSMLTDGLESAFGSAERRAC